MIVMSHQQYQQILSHALTWLPNEACGLIAGSIEGDTKTVQKLYLLDNTDASPSHFTISPPQQLQAIKDMRANGYTALGNFHSHPSTPSRSSEEDIRLAHDPNASYLILSLAIPEAPVLKSFSVQNGISSEEVLQIIDSPT